MPTIHAALTHTYQPTPTAPVGFEATFEVYDATAGGGTGQVFVTCIHVDTTNATYWSLDALTSTGKRQPDGTPLREPAHAYDPHGIDATWTERISDVAAAPTTYVLKARFDSPGGMIQVQAQTTQLADPSNRTRTETLSIPIPAFIE